MQTMVIGARQIKAARALLDWSQEDLATLAELSVATIRKLELGHVSPRNSTNIVIRRALENAGLEFIEPQGVRRKPEGMATYQGTNGLALFMDDIFQSMHHNGEENILISAPEIFFKDKCSYFYAGLKRIAEARNLTNVKCLLAHAYDHLPSLPFFEFRSISKHYIDPIPFLVYSGKHALIASDDSGGPKIVVLQSLIMTQLSRRHFLSIWDKTAPLGVKNRSAGSDAHLYAT